MSGYSSPRARRLYRIEILPHLGHTLTNAVLRDKIKGTMNCIVTCPKNQSTTRQISRLNPFLVMRYRVSFCFPRFCERESYNNIPSPPSSYVHNRPFIIAETKAAGFSETPVPLCQLSSATTEKTATLEFILFLG